MAIVRVCQGSHKTGKLNFVLMPYIENRGELRYFLVISGKYHEFSKSLISSSTGFPDNDPVKMMPFVKNRNVCDCYEVCSLGHCESKVPAEKLIHKYFCILFSE